MALLDCEKPSSDLALPEHCEGFRRQLILDVHLYHIADHLRPSDSLQIHLPRSVQSSPVFRKVPIGAVAILQERLPFRILHRRGAARERQIKASNTMLADSRT